jgi:hypothetical protein
LYFSGHEPFTVLEESGEKNQFGNILAALVVGSDGFGKQIMSRPESPEHDHRGLMLIEHHMTLALPLRNCDTLVG